MAQYFQLLSVHCTTDISCFLNERFLLVVVEAIRENLLTFLKECYASTEYDFIKCHLEIADQFE